MSGRRNFFMMTVKKSSSSSGLRRFLESFPTNWKKHDNNQRLYFTTTTDFKNFAPEKLFFDAGYSAIDGFILKDGKRYVLINKDNSRTNLNLRVAFAKTPLGLWENVSEPFTEKFTEGPCALKIGDDWLIYFDAYREKIYGAVKTRDFKTFTNVTKEVSFPEGHKHGTAIQVPREILDGLLKKFRYLLSKNQFMKKLFSPPHLPLFLQPCLQWKTNSDAQAEIKYTAAIEGRTADILKILALSDTNKAAKVHNIIIAQYRALNAWHK